ncbi:MAG: tetratricopeptide repeat protein [Desulfobacterales bacterium]|jgi:tetratricopeptide (TPR) repeat protein
MAFNRISRARKRDLEKPDGFLNWSSRFLQAVSRYQTHLFWGVIGVLAVVSAVGLYGVYGRRADTKAATELSRLTSVYQNEMVSGTPQSALEKIQADMAILIDQYGHRTPGQMAKVLLAGYYLEARQPEKAIEFYQSAMGDAAAGSYVAAVCLNGLGYAYEESGDFSAALGSFQQVAESQSGGLRADALYNAARMHSLLGNIEESRSALKDALEEDPGYLYADLIKAEIPKERSTGD